MTRSIALAALTVLELSPPDMVSCAAEAGYSHIGLRLIPATPTEVSYATIGDTPIIRATLARLADTGIRCFDVEILRLKPETRVADFLPVLETAARLGARAALIAGNDPDEGRLMVARRDRTVGQSARQSPFVGIVESGDERGVRKTGRVSSTRQGNRRRAFPVSGEGSRRRSNGCRYRPVRASVARMIGVSPIVA